MREIMVTVDKALLLEKLKKNREQHAQVVKEAREGYLKKAQEALDARMQQLRDGKLVALHFDLRLPSDHTSDYNTVIGMLEMSVDTQITISSAEYRMYVEDEWAWLHEFLLSNTAYSPTSVGMARSKGLL